MEGIKLKRYFSLFCVMMLLAGCPGIPRESSSGLSVDPRVEVCSLGTKVSLSTNAKASISKILEGEAALDGSVSREIETIFSKAGADQLSQENLVKAQQQFYDCLASESERELAASKPWVLMTSEQCTAAYQCEDRVMSKYRTCLDITGGDSNCNSGLAQNSSCWGVSRDNLSIARSTCSAKFGEPA